MKFAFLLFIIFSSCTKSDVSKKESKSNLHQKKPQINYSNIQDSDDCVDYVALWSAEDISKELGLNKKWVFLNYTVDIWDTPPAEGKGKPIGRLRASSYAQIIDYTQNDYLVESPITKVHGWVSNSHVKSITRKHPVTKKLCNE